MVVYNNVVTTLQDAIEEFLVYQSSVKNISPNSVKGYSLDLQKLQRCLYKQKFNIDISDLGKLLQTQDGFATQVARSSQAVSATQVAKGPQVIVAAKVSQDVKTEAIANSSQTTLPDIILSEITTGDLRSAIGLLTIEKRAPASINRFIAAVRSLFAYCRRLSYIKSDPSLEVKTVKNPIRIPAFMTKDEVTDLCHEPEKTHLLWTSRDYAIFELLYSSGCRVSELAGITLSDMSGDYTSAIVLGKGRKERRVFFSSEATKAVKLYLQERGLYIHKEAPAKQLFINRRGTGLTDRGIRWIVMRYSSVEGTNKPVSPHAFRHTFATTMLREGADIRVVQELLGHSSISTTQRYTHITAASLIETYNRAHPHGKE